MHVNDCTNCGHRIHTVHQDDDNGCTVCNGEDRTMALRGELVNWEIERQKAKQMRDIELCGAISDAGAAFKSAELMGYGSGYYADQISVYKIEQKKRRGKSEFEKLKEAWLEMNRIYGQ